MDREASSGIDESSLSKGEIRKLKALRKSVGNEIGDKAFAEWLSSRPAGLTRKTRTQRRSSMFCGRWSKRAG